MLQLTGTTELDFHANTLREGEKIQKLYLFHIKLKYLSMGVLGHLIVVSLLFFCLMLDSVGP